MTQGSQPASGSAAAGDRAVPLTLLTGFLGAGKTTLVNRVLNGDLGVPVGVLVNDFGALDIDRALIAGASEGVLSLENGCICCSLRGDLVTSVMHLLERPERPQRVLLEASGVADPAPIVGTFMAPAFRHRLRLDGVICVVDAEQAFTTPAVAALQLRQVGFADLVVLNKIDLAGTVRTRDIATRIRREFTGARLAEAVHCNVPAEVLFSVSSPLAGATLAMQDPGASHGPSHATQFEAAAFETAKAFGIDALHDLGRRLPPSIYRAKGIVRLRGRGNRPDRRGVLQIVGRRTDLVSDRPWRREDGVSRLVFIGAAGESPAGCIEALVNDCLCETGPADPYSMDNMQPAIHT